MARLCVALQITPGEYRRLTLAERNALVGELNRVAELNGADVGR